MIQILTDNLFGLTPPTREVVFFWEPAGVHLPRKTHVFVAPF